MSKIRVGILYGGRSAEHEVSLVSAKNILAAIDRDTYDVTEIFIDQSGKWDQTLLTADRLDIVFPVLHGANGEDGTIQGLLQLLDLPFVGPDVLASALCMDKDIVKRLLDQAGLPVTPWETLTGTATAHQDAFDRLSEAYGCPFFIKPARTGSSVGVSKVRTASEYLTALDDAFRYDQKVLVEKAIVGHEVEVAVLGNEEPQASVVGELIVHADFYSYDAKYHDPNGATPVIPANLPGPVMEKIRSLALEAFRVTGCEGMARVDFFVSEAGKIFINELNTIPGFTEISMYPKLWQASGLTYSELIDQLLTLGLKRFERDRQRQTTYSPR